MDVWVAVAVISLGFVVAGVAVTIPSWPTLVVGVVLILVGGAFALARGIMDRAH